MPFYDNANNYAGYLTQTDIVKLKLFADKVNLDSARLADLVKTDETSKLKKQMLTGVNYYACQHDILDRKKWYWLKGVKVEDVTISNYKMVHPFASILIDQKANYIAGKPPVIACDDETALKNINDQIEDSFDEDMIQWITGASKKGVEWMHFYINERGEFNSIITPAEQIIPVYDSQYQKELIYVIRYYLYNLVLPSGESVERHKLEWWTKDTVEYWVEDYNKNWTLDSDYELNPAPHFYTFNTSAPGNRQGYSWGRVPFVCLANNDEMHSDISRIKCLIDAYDLIDSDFVNDLNDVRQLILVLKNYMTTEDPDNPSLKGLGLFQHNLHTYGVMTVDGEGGVESLKNEVPVVARKEMLANLEKQIFYFGQGIDPSDTTISSAASGVALKFLYGPLDLKSNALILKLKRAIKDYIWFVCAYLGIAKGLQIDPAMFKVVFNKSVISNDAETIKDLATSDWLTKQTKIELDPRVEDAEEEMKRWEEQDAKDGADMSDLFGDNNANKPPVNGQ